MSDKLRNRAVVITSGTKRLGLAMAKEALRLGFDTIMHYRSHRSEADRWLRRNTEYRNRILFMQRDLTPASAAQFISDAALAAPRLVGLVNNASLFTPGNLNDQRHFQTILESNALVPAALVAAFTHTVQRGWVVNITDATIDAVNSTYQNYRISKLLLSELTRQQAILLAPDIRVNAIAPGAILPPEGTSPREFASRAESIPLRRTGTLDDIRRTFAYLVQNDYLTGHVLPVDGGQSAAGDGKATAIRRA
jgi:pteridine reductase